ncbi:MAG: peptidase M28, partial [Cyclobacteriaceae bacterium]|nr:peptidase M28 [Cyclobacteriaceae bacterium]
MKSHRLILLSLLVLTGYYGSAQTIEEKNIEKHIKALSSDEMQGRQTGSEGERLARNYIEKEFKKLKLTPKGSESYSQSFTFKGGNH